MDQVIGWSYRNPIESAQPKGFCHEQCIQVTFGDSSCGQWPTSGNLGAAIFNTLHLQHFEVFGGCRNWGLLQSYDFVLQNLHFFESRKGYFLLHCVNSESRKQWKHVETVSQIHRSPSNSTSFFTAENSSNPRTLGKGVQGSRCPQQTWSDAGTQHAMKTTATTKHTVYLYLP